MLLHSRATKIMQAPVVHPSVRPSIKPIWSETFKRMNTKFCGMIPVHHLPRPFSSFFFYYLNFFIFAYFVFVFANIGSHWRKNFQMTSHLKEHNRITPRNHVYYSGGSLQNCQRIENFQILDSCHFFFFFVNIEPYGKKSFKRHLLWMCTPDLFSIIHVHSWGRVSAKVVNKRNVKFWIFSKIWTSRVSLTVKCLR